MSVNLESLLRRYKGKKINIFNDDDGSKVSDTKAREYIAECLAKGWKIIPIGTCEGFDHFGGGCPGHPEVEEGIKIEMINPLSKKEEAAIYNVSHTDSFITTTDKTD